MARWRVWFECLGRAIGAGGLRAVMGAIPLGEAVYDIASNMVEQLRRHGQEDQMRAALQDLAQAPAQQVKQVAEEVSRQVASDQPQAVQKQVSLYLSLVPALVRQSLRRPADPSGKTVPATLSLSSPRDLLPLLPSRLPCFQPGDQPPGIGDWELVELLGMGGFGEVWKARHRFFDGIAPVVLKFCLDDSVRSRLLKYEASVLNQVMRQGKHPGIVPLLDAFLSVDPPCLKYEYIEGGDLAGLVQEWQLLPGQRRFAKASQLLLSLARIVGYAHRLRPPIVHRDLKPANVLVQPGADGDYLLRVTDFGIGGVAALASEESVLRGSCTPLYASPQQMRGEPPDPRDDVHALGVIWYQLLTGDLSSGAPTGLWTEELEVQGLSRDLIKLLGACVSGKLERRPADAQALADQLGPLLQPSKPGPDRVQGFLKSLEKDPHSWVLDLTNKQLRDEGVITLTQSTALQRVGALYLSGNGVTDAGAKALAESAAIANLTRLVLWENLIGDTGVAALASSPHLGKLTTLDLGSNRLGDAGAIALAGSPYLGNLTVLVLVSNQIGDEGARALAGSPHLVNLAELKLLGNPISSAGATALKERFGKRVRIY
jgi:serine/threonine protein kinase